MNGNEELFVTQFNALSLLGALFLWGAFFLLGVIARRYELVFQKWTGWKSMMLAPSGILLYVGIITIGWFTGGDSIQKPLEFVAYSALLLSAVACLSVVIRFHRVIRQLTETTEGQ
jgi:ascorbate-specific PTS system EIIC-type component UlaA